MLIMYLLGMLFHPANVSSLNFALELKSCSAFGETANVPGQLLIAVYQKAAFRIVQYVMTHPV